MTLCAWAVAGDGVPVGARREAAARGVEHGVQAAAQFWRAGEFRRAQAYLALVEPDLARGTEVQHRRWITIAARVARSQGDSTRERRYLRELVEYPGAWPSGLCQGCHADPANPRAVPLLDLSAWWAMERYVALLRLSKTARAERDEARALLAFNPSDAAVRLRLAAAQRALGEEAAALATLKTLPWLKFPDRTGPIPRDIHPYPDPL